MLCASIDMYMLHTIQDSEGFGVVFPVDKYPDILAKLNMTYRSDPIQFC